MRTRTLFLAKIAAVGTALFLLILALHALAGVVWPFAFNKPLPAQVMPAFASDPAIPPVEASDMQSVMNRDLKELQQSGIFARAGLAIGVVRHGVRRVFTYGTAKPDSIFEIASVTKTFTALTLARMAEENKVELDQPVRELLPPGTVEKPSGNEITLLDLATQHSGLPRMPANFHPENDNPFADFHSADLYEFIARHGLRKPADASFVYSNVGVGLLGQALANRAQSNYADLVKKEVTDPLGLQDTVVSLSAEQQSRFIQGHDGLTDGPDGFRRFTHAYGDPVPPWDFDALAGAGALHSTAGDMLTYLEANLHPRAKGGMLQTALLDTQKLHANVDELPGMRIALIWLCSPDGCYLHDGASLGHTTFAFFNPKEDYAAIVLSNGFLSAQLVGAHIRQRLAGLPALSLSNVAIPASGGGFGFVRLFAVYWATMLAAGAFIYCCVLALQGLTSQLLPRRWFLHASSFLQLAAFCVILCVYFLQPLLAAPNPFDIHSSGLPGWSPSYWFLGLFQQLNGSPALAPLAARAWIGLASAAGATAVAYTLSYVRSLRKIVEEPDIPPGSRYVNWLPRFGTSLETAVVQFSMRTLLRSRQHRVILAFYLGIGFAATVFLLRSPMAKEISKTTVGDPWREVSAPLLAASMILMGFWVVGMRAVFSLPLDLPANWIFRMTPVRAGSKCVSALRRSLWMLAVAPAFACSAIVFLSMWPWRAAVGHLVLLALLGVTLTEFCLLGNQKIPFTCSWLPGKSNFHIAFWFCILLILEIVLKVADLEQRVLAIPVDYAAIVIILASLGGLAAWRTSRLAESDIESLHFEEIPSWQLTTLELPR